MLILHLLNCTLWNAKHHFFILNYPVIIMQFTVILKLNQVCLYVLVKYQQAILVIYQYTSYMFQLTNNVQVIRKYCSIRKRDYTRALYKNKK